MVNFTTLDLRLPIWTAHTHRRQRVRAIRTTYAEWMRRFPRWANAGFDEYFLLHDALPLLTAMLDGTLQLEPHTLAQTWVTAFGIPETHRARAVAEMTPVAADYLTRLQIACGACVQ